MLIESDLFIALLKDKDRLKPAASEILKAIEDGRIKDAYGSVAVLQEIIFWLLNEGRSSDILTTINIVSNTKNLEWVNFDKDICLSASAIMEEYKFSPFDAYHAATAISRDSKIISSDHAYDKIKSISRINLLSYFARP